MVYENIEKILGWNGVTPHMVKTNTPFRKMGHVTIKIKTLKKPEELPKMKNTIRVITVNKN
jgi:5-(carboxyamino)imidazole ribonucleotide synthase